MEKKKINKILLIMFSVVLLILILSTIYKINKNHEDKLYSVLYSKIEYQANKCYLENFCDKEIVLKDLYEKKYLDILYDPISKEKLDENIKIKINKEGMCANVIIDGKIMYENLKSIHKDEKWLKKQLKVQGHNYFSNILLSTVDINGKLVVYEKNNNKNDRDFLE